jgi:ribonuclease HI/predicted RNA-binding Zn-ribbon protein involved in translation (DUF1610 family)
MNERITVNFDGGSRGNPGLAGIGIVLEAEDGTPLVTIGRCIGTATNNVAEYTALIGALREAKKLGATKVLVRGDSELVIKQMRGEYRVKNPGLKVLYEQARKLAGEFDKIAFEHNLRHHNELADRLANLAMDCRAEVTDVDAPPARSAGGSTHAPTNPSDAIKTSFSADRAEKTSPRFSCPECGCEIEIKKKSSRPGHDGGKFICRCGTEMEG